MLEACYDEQLVLDYFYMLLKFHSSILLRINDSYLTRFISFSYCKFAEFN